MFAGGGSSVIASIESRKRAIFRSRFFTSFRIADTLGSEWAVPPRSYWFSPCFLHFQSDGSEPTIHSSGSDLLFPVGDALEEVLTLNGGPCVGGKALRSGCPFIHPFQPDVHSRDGLAPPMEQCHPRSMAGTFGAPSAQDPASHPKGCDQRRDSDKMYAKKG